MGRKVLFTASTYSHIVNFHLPYLRKFQEEGWTVHVACGGKAMLIPYADEVTPLSFKKSMFSLANLKAAIRLSDQIRKEGYSLVCTHTSLAAFFTRLSFWGLEECPPVVNMIHGYLFDDDTPRLKRDLLLTAERWMAPVTDLVLTMNQWDYETALKYQLGRRVAQIPGVGVDFSRFDRVAQGARSRLRAELGILEKAHVLIYAAEFSARKSQAVLIRAMELLPDNVILALPGSGALLQECRELANQLGMADRVYFPGQIRDMPSWYAMADIAVASSRSEGLPFNIMEAMYAGLPVIASDVKGHQDLVSDAETGLLYRYGDEKACAERVWQLIGSETLRRRLAVNAREYVKQYSLKQVFPKVWMHYTASMETMAFAGK